MVLRLFFIGALLSVVAFSYQGKGEGKSKREALTQALDDIASQISITIDSELTVNKEANSESYHRTVQKSLRSKVANVSFSNYEIVSEKKQGDEYRVVVNVDKKRLAASYARTLEDALKAMDQKLKSTSSRVKRYRILKEIDLQSLIAQKDLIEVIDHTYPTQTFRHKISHYTELLNQPIAFNITTTSPEVKQIVEDLLSQKGFSSVLDEGVAFKVTFASIQENKLYKQYIGTTNATVSIKENTEVIYSQTFKVSGSSTISQEYAYRDILNNFREKLSKELKEIL